MRPPGLVAWVRAEARYLRAQLIQAGYVIRPYDMLADRRRWRWQPARPCGLSVGFSDGVADYRAWKADNPEAAARWEAWCERIDRGRRPA